MLQKKIEVIISKSKIIAESLNINLPSSNIIEIFSLNQHNQDELLEFPKIDSLIIDERITRNIPLYNVNNIINLTDLSLTNKDIFLKKPLKLAELLQIMSLNRAKNQIFCRFNQEWIYDEQMCKLLNQTSSVRLTEKENELFKYLLLASDYKMAKDELFSKGWNYSSEANSTTFETHMSRLKQKLPQDLLLFKNNYYELIITDIV